MLAARRRQLEEALSRHQADLERWQNSLAESRKRQEAYQKLTAQQADIEAGYAALAAARQQQEELDNKARRLYQLKERHAQLERGFLQAQNELNARYKVVEDRIAKLEAKSAGLEGLRRDMAALQPRHKEMREAQSAITAQRDALRDKNADLARLGAGAASLISEAAQLQEKLDLLPPCDEAVCPLCRSELGAERLELVRDTLSREQAQKKAEAEKLEQGRQVGEAQLSRMNAELDRLEAEIKSKNNLLVSDVARLTEAIKEANEAESQLKAEQEALAAVAQSLASRDYAGDTLERLNETEAAIAAIDYDEKGHETARNRVKELEPYDNLKRSLDEALRLLPEEQNKAEQAAAAIDDIHKRQQQDRASLEETGAKLGALPELQAELAAAEAGHRECAAGHHRAQERLGSLKERLGYLEGLEAKIKDRQQALTQAARRQEIYEELALAFGKKGIQAMLIETSLPEIEDEANRLLGRMTEGRMSVNFETQRDTKKGDIAETLDIKIGDELGTRDYEMFSGGEAFRIDFAIRIALSRLLARRAGAPLPTLIIDEGFGTQDAEGIEKLKEAIISIQDEFKKIIVVTHIEELKDAFPTRINVVKTEGGSRIEVSEG
jgi:exonuclease SbcC